ncbi:RagB/SusD family nutrient uptake outer membrane protein [Sphingobacterium sp. DK4209]|uniref:RagB/SusD family nutrient uptake outer membrane protein n=1 Tax=Sphingobacterium zhuxiongii TaxID=2662364 RepID=A0A5Q0QI82_9SPHI|nr:MULTISPECIES: RagB/SusD family nutrient uptake outer membrane protein [unclassified Sphingobacterium]MVZ65700.1 RagB/SusD family nutrient uptake outer membrane protein [Sphingobacterium sp. DK4209]QGA27898.1 RagB/SusD family nutrient uptake outer membrane protein [Sphingobacterium sp. dk4302]
MRNLYKVLIACSLIGLSSSCKKWLDVQPKTNISENVLFENEQGFKDALTGVYILLAGSDFYAKEFTMGTMDVLAQQYDVSANTNQYYETGRYNYTNATVQSNINRFWYTGYKAIANINNILQAIELRKSVFAEGMYERIKGEALGLRAMIHFDLFRAFGPIPSKGLTGETIPYVNVFEMKVKPNVSGTDFIEACYADLNQAIDLLSLDKQVVYGTIDPFTSHTRNHFNYWAANGLKARIALYIGDKDLAYQQAKFIIDQGAKLFPFVERNNLAGTSPYRALLPEQLFGIYTPNLHQINEDLFRSTSGQSTLSNKASFLTAVFEGSSTDVRSVFLWKTDGTSADKYPAKYRDDDIQTNLLNTRRIPLMRMSEIYFIGAESSNIREERIEWMNKVIAVRGAVTISSTADMDQIDANIVKEYRKEFYQEGQLFFYHKRKNTLRIEGSSIDMTEAQYVFPKPNDEIEFNN